MSKEFFKHKFEFNDMPAHEQNADVVCEMSANDIVCETNKSQSVEKLQKQAKAHSNIAFKARMSLISAFLFVCVAVTMIQPNMYIPLFSDLLVPKTTATEQVWYVDVEFDGINKNAKLNYTLKA